ncbi:MAG: hypothetical protein R3A79_28545 [Nannocystaceae bacterium]
MTALGPSPDARAALAAADAAIDAAAPSRGTLAPGRARAHTLAAVVAAITTPSDPPPLVDALAFGLAEVAEAQRDAFPDNLLWDFDFMAASVLREARGAATTAAAARLAHDRCRQIAGLQHLYGRETAIAFTYVHDFVYGYDWAKWIRRDPPPRRAHGPYSAAFLAYMERRGHELLALIADNDRKYPALADERPRNPFPFSREPADELTLHRALARRGEVPVEAWRVDAAPAWDRNFAALRAERARVLGLSRTR